MHGTWLGLWTSCSVVDSSDWEQFTVVSGMSREGRKGRKGRSESSPKRLGSPSISAPWPLLPSARVSHPGAFASRR